MSNKNNPKKGKRAEQKIAKGISGTRKAGPNSPDIKKGQDRVEVKDFKNPLTKAQLQKAYQQNHANVIVSTKGFTGEALEYAKKNMPRVQLRKGKTGKILVKRRRNKQQ
jgi:hypothetical protein